jgi:putative lipoprotein
LGLGAAILVGAGKEGWDAMGHGDPSWKDFTWDVAGALVGVGLSLLVDAAARPATTTY